MSGGYTPLPTFPTPPAAAISHVVILSGQITVVKDNGEVWTLGREGGVSHAPLEWQQLPTVPGTEAWNAERASRQAESAAPDDIGTAPSLPSPSTMVYDAVSPMMAKAEREGIR